MSVAQVGKLYTRSTEMLKMTIVGAGSAIFSKNIIMDTLSFKELQDCIISLMDIDEKRLKLTETLVKKIIKQENLPTKVEATTNLSKALEGANFVIVTIDVGGTEAVEYDNMIPYKYGIDQCIGDTLGPGGIFKGFKLTVPLLEICRKLEEICPDALLINYSNPMAINCWVINSITKVKCVGLCHGIPLTAKFLASYINVPYEEIDYWVAGINHQAWFLKFTWKGEDAYPLIWEKLKKPGEPKTDKIRFELMKALGYFCTETSGHSSEYLPYFRRRKDIMEKFCGEGYQGESLFYCKNIGKWRKIFAEEVEKLISSPQISLGERSKEYVADIIYAITTNKIYRFNGNVQNTGLISNLPEGCCVEVPCFADGFGIHPSYVGELPPQCAAINRTNINTQELAVKAAISGDRELAFQAVLVDPLTSSVLAPHEIRKMVNEMLEAQRKFLPQFFK